MTRNHWMRLSAAVSVAALLGCVKGEQAGQSADSTARNLTLAPTESTAAMKDVPPPADKAPPTTGAQGHAAQATRAHLLQALRRDGVLGQRRRQHHDPFG